ncbi:MAG: glycosyltransferase [Ferruginibacter sp.]
MAIPKVIYQTFKTNKLPWLTKIHINKFRKKNSSYRYEFYDDAAIETFLEEAYGDEILKLYKRINIGAAKADFFRYAILYKKGGVYLDIDSLIKKNLDGLIKPDDEAIIAREGHPGLYAQWALIYNAGHPFLAKTMEKVIDNLQQNRFPHDVHKMTGPTVYTEAIEECLSQNTEINFRTYKVDYGDFFKFKYAFNKIVYSNRSEHWKTQQLKTPILKPAD